MLVRSMVDPPTEPSIDFVIADSDATKGAPSPLTNALSGHFRIASVRK